MMVVRPVPTLLGQHLVRLGDVQPRDLVVLGASCGTPCSFDRSIGYRLATWSAQALRAFRKVAKACSTL